MKWQLAFGLILCWAASAAAHKPSDSLLALQSADTLIEGQWDIALRDLDHAIGLDTDGDAAITWVELRRHHTAIAAYALSRLQMQSDAGPCTLDVRAHLIDRHSDGTYAVLRFVADCGPRPNSLTVRYRLFFDLDPQHRGILRVGDSEQVVLFSVDTLEQRVVLADAVSRTVAGFWRSGIRHAGDLDQVLFLAVLFLPVRVLVRRVLYPSSVVPAQAGIHSRSALPVSGMDPRLRGDDGVWSALKLLAALTLAHSLTFTLVVQHSLSLPSHILDAAVALSVVVAALSHLSPALAPRRWMIAFAFGLLHGFEVAAALTDSALPLSVTARDLLSFNLGLVTGQFVLTSALLLIIRGMTSAPLSLVESGTLARNPAGGRSTSYTLSTTPPDTLVS